MYMSQHRFTPVPEKLHLWLPYNRNYMTLTARVEGASLSRILHLLDSPQEYLAIGVWTDKESAVRWSDSDESRLGAKPNVDQGLYDGYPMTWTRWDLIDFAWGLDGPELEEDPDLFVRHITWPLDPDQKGEQESVCRTALSLLARQPGFVSGETYRGHKGDKLLLIHTWRSKQAWPFEGAAVPEPMAWLAETSVGKRLEASFADAKKLSCSMHQLVWGPARARLNQVSKVIAA